MAYNTFPWPEPTETQVQTVKTAAQDVLDTRIGFEGATLADLCDPVTVPGDLLRAHKLLDRAVDIAYGRTAFRADADRVAFLFARYETLTSLLPRTAEKKKR
jgi:hypothetical protein